MVIDSTQQEIIGLRLKLGTLIAQYDATLKESLKETGAEYLQVTELHVLAALYKQAPQKAGVLAGSINRAPTAFTPIVDRLVEFGLVRREYSETDRRTVDIFLTVQGEALRGIITGAIAQAEAVYSVAAHGLFCL